MVLSLKNLLVCLFASFAMHATHAQLLKVWEFTLDGNGSSPLSFNVNSSPLLKTFRTADGDFITVSAKSYITYSHYARIYVYRFTATGNVVWEYEFDSPYKIKERIHGASMDAQGNLYIAAETTIRYTGGFEPQEGSNALLLKISSQGELLWSYESPSPPVNWYASQYCMDVANDPAGNLYTAVRILDSIQTLILIQKRNDQGSLIWQDTIPFANRLYLQVFGPNLIVVCPENTSTIYHFNLQDGHVNFTNTIPKVYWSEPAFDANGNWYTPHPTGKFRIAKRNIYGDTLWNYHYPTNLPGNVSADEIEDVHVNPDGSIMITGRHYGAHYGDTSKFSNCDVLTVKLNPQGQPQWINRYQFNDLRSCQIGQKVVTNQQYLTFVAGYQSVRDGADPYASSDMMILVYDPSGHLIDSLYYSGPGHRDDFGVNLILEGNALYLLGWTTQADSLFDQTIIKYGYEYSVLTNESAQSNFLVYPNPVNGGEVVIKSAEPPLAIALYDLSGQLRLYNDNVNQTTSIVLPPDISPGWYYLRIRWENNSSSVPLIVVHN